MHELIASAQARIAEALGRHEHAALEFGGGKDSLACLYLLRPWWDRLTVLWGNPGDPFPETVALMEEVRPLVRDFHEARGKSRQSTAREYPVDLLPMRATRLGRLLEPDGAKVTLRSRFDCCYENLWAPMAKLKSDLGITLIFRGQRDSESLRSPLSNGDRISADTPELCLPIQAWGRDEVFAYLEAEKVPIPSSYAYAPTSLDCMLCTAYVDEARGRLKYLRQYFPDDAREYEIRMQQIRVEQEHGRAEWT